MPHSKVISVPGRVNLIGEHIDYHQLPVLPMAIQRSVSITFHPRSDSLVRAVSEGHPDRQFPLAEAETLPPGDWGNYLKAAVNMIARRWTVTRGVNVTITSDLPLAAGLSSSSALLTGFALALLHSNEIYPTVHEIMELLPEGEHFVGTRGGGMDHAAVVASRGGSALLVHFAPLRFEPIPVPPDWAFLIAHSLTVAEKSGSVRAEYNARRTAGLRALEQLELSSFRDALARHCPRQLGEMAVRLKEPDRGAFLHVVSEAERVTSAVTALQGNHMERFGEILSASHASLRDHLRVSNAALDELVAAAMQSGALGARLTGAGFGGCAIILCKMSDYRQVSGGLVDRFYSRRPGFVPANHLILAQPSSGALSV